MSSTFNIFAASGSEENLHIKSTAGALHHRFTDATHAYNTESFIFEGESNKASWIPSLPITGPHIHTGVTHAPCTVNHKAESNICSGIRQHVRSIAQIDSISSAIIHIDVVKANSIIGDHFKSLRVLKYTLINFVGQHGDHSARAFGHLSQCDRTWTSALFPRESGETLLAKKSAGQWKWEGKRDINLIHAMIIGKSFQDVRN